jgi:hypothetical protein
VSSKRSLEQRIQDLEAKLNTGNDLQLFRVIFSCGMVAHEELYREVRCLKTKSGKYVRSLEPGELRQGDPKWLTKFDPDGDEFE